MPYIHEPTGDEVELERWQWVALYKDGTRLKQFDDQGKFHQVAEIDMANLHAFHMVCGDKIETLLVEPNMQVFHYYRVLKKVSLTTGELVAKIKVYCFGFKDKDSGLTVTKAITPTDEVITTTDTNRLDLR